MVNVFTLRRLVDSGFTIANRRGLEKIVGKNELGRLFAKYSECRPRSLRLKLPNHEKEFSILDFNLNLNGNSYNLTMNTEIAASSAKGTKLNFTDGEINLDSISRRIDKRLTEVEQYYKSAGKLPEAFWEENKTMDLLFSKKFNFRQGKNSDGYYRTSLIDKKSREPVNAYVKCLKEGSNVEHWGIFVKNSSGEYERVGIRKYHLDDKSKTIHTGFMESRNGRDLYSGIGIRLHQITIERMMQKGYKRLVIESEPNAFPFHYKCGFRSPDIVETVPKSSIDEFTNEFLKQGLTPEEVNAALRIRPNGENFDISAVSAENLMKALYLKNNGNIISNEMLVPMELYGEHLAKWQSSIRSQPILQRQNIISMIKNCFS